jgi:hypothetical protein
MQVNCPACESSFPGSSGITQVCPACMHSFELGASSGVPSLMNLELQGAHGEAMGQFDFYQIRQMIYGGEVKGKEFIREPGGEWGPVYDRADLHGIFELVGIDLVKIRLSSQRIQGWRKDESAQESPKSSPRVRPQSTRQIRRDFSGKQSEGVDPKVWKALGLGLLVFVILMWKLF